MSVIALWLFLMVPWVGLQCVIVVFPGNTHCFAAVRSKAVNLLYIPCSLLSTVGYVDNISSVDIPSTNVNC